MYLSRLILNLRHRGVQRDLGASYELHRSVMRAFPAALPEGERVLFRVDEHPRLEAPMLLVQSLRFPDWSWLGEEERLRGYLLPVSEPNPAVKPFDPALRPGQRLAFRLRANPTIKHHAEDGRPLRAGLYREAEQLAWLHRKGEAGGFRVLSVTAAAEGNVGGRQKGEAESRRLTFFAVRFDGVLAVDDPDRLRAALAAGIGSGKGLGFGLLSLAPAPG